MTVQHSPRAHARATRHLGIEFMYLDLTTCTRCLGAGRNLETALDEVRGVLTERGIEVTVEAILVTSAEQARRLRFLSSPTIRIDGEDVALELRESPCGSEACTDGCGDGIDCRVWVHRGREHTEPPVEMIVEAVLRHVDGVRRPHAVPPAPYALPENLARFFAGREPVGGACCASPGPGEPCCAAGELSDADCCGVAEGEVCGCR